MPARSRVDRLLPPVGSSGSNGDGLATTVSRHLANAIRLGLLQPGEQLPAEVVLAGQLGVSTVTLRDSLSLLREQGLVETRRGRHGGSFVCGPAAISVSRLHQRLDDLSVIGLRDLGDEWVAIAGTTARLAAARSSAEQVDGMSRFARRLGEATGIDERSRASSRFFIEVALASQSERLTRAEVRVQTEIGDLLWLPTDRPLDAAATSADLAAITEAIAAEDGQMARELTERRVTATARWLVQTRLERSGDGLR